MRSPAERLASSVSRDLTEASRFPNRPIGDSRGIGFSEADHGAHEVRWDYGACNAGWPYF